MRPAPLRPAFVIAALVLAALSPARAGELGPAPGNALNPAPVNPTTAGRWMDEEGIGTRIPAARNPAGQFYNIPIDPGGEADDKSKEWKTWGFVEMGGMTVLNDDRSQGWRNYKDLRDGFYVNAFGLAAERPGEARYLEVTGGALGRLDQYYRLQVGRLNDWKVSAWFDSTPQVFTTSYRSLWSGQGTANLTLSGLTPGGTTNAATTQANIQRALADTPASDLEAVRKKAGVRIDANLGETWKLFAVVTDEKRKGSRPFGAVFGGGGGGGNLEVSESIDYDTLDFVAGAQWNDAVSSFNVRASASYFHNNIDTEAFQNPLFVTLNGSSGLQPTSFTQGTFDLVPDNQHYNLKGEYARALPSFYRGNFTATMALGSMRQDAKLVAPTEFPLTGGTVSAGGASLANVWNTPGALSRDSARQRIDTALADFALLLRPANGLDVKGKVRYYETRNESDPYLACNPITGQWGRILNDGSGLSLVTANTTPGTNPAGTSANAYNATGCNLAALLAMNLVPAAGNVPISNAPADYKQLNASITGDYRIGRATSVTGVLERETFDRRNRERDETWEDRVKLGWVDRGTIEGTMRLSYEYARRGGGDYNVNAFDPFLSASLGPQPTSGAVSVPSWIHTIAQFRSFDLADRRQNLLNGRVDYSLFPTLEGAFSFQMKDATFPSSYGRTGKQRSDSATFDLTYQAGSSMVVYGHYTWQRGSMEQKGVQPNACTLGSTYYFYSDGRVLTAATGAPPPATPDGVMLVATQDVTGAGWTGACTGASPTSPLFPESRAWDVDSRDRSDVFGFGAKFDLGRVKLDMNFNRSLGRTRIGYDYNPAALGLTPVQAALAGKGFSDLTFAQSVLDASAWVPVTPNVVMRFMVRHETGKVRDWHYDGVAANPMPANNALYLDGGPQDYRATMVGILVHVRM